MRRLYGGRLLLQFLDAQLPQAANKKHQLPTVVALLVVRFRPARHAGEPHAVAYDVTDFSIGQILS